MRTCAGQWVLVLFVSLEHVALITQKIILPHVIYIHPREEDSERTGNSVQETSVGEWAEDLD